MIRALRSLMDRMLGGNPWLYGLVVVSSVGIILVIFFGYVWPGVRGGGEVTQQPETPEEKVDRLAIMNSLNRFILEEAEASENATDEERMQLRMDNVVRMRDDISHIDTNNAIEGVQQRLVQVLTQWETALENNRETLSIRRDFIALSRDYPWLSTLVGLIIVNRL